MAHIGEKLSKVRKLKGLKQDYMADKMGMSQSNYSRLENEPDRLTVKQLLKASEILEIDPSNLLTDDEKLVFNIESQNQNGEKSSGFVINNFPEKLLEQNNLLIQELSASQTFMKEEIKFLRDLVTSLRK